MNVLIKNSDFSQVSVGTVGELPIGSVLYHGFLRPSGNIDYSASRLNCVCVDLSQSTATKIRVHGYSGRANKCLCAFYSGSMPSSDITFTSSSEASDFSTSMGKLGNISTTETTSIWLTMDVDIPEGTNTLVINVGENGEPNAWAIELYN